ncbi:MAG: hypothetical protein AAGG51_06070 [Cyanobacteria bacterium P01_G01_bin.54]
MANATDIIITATDMSTVHRKLTHPKILQAARSGLVSLFLDRHGCVLTVPNRHVDIYMAHLNRGLKGIPGLQIAKK